MDKGGAGPDNSRRGLRDIDISTADSPTSATAALEAVGLRLIDEAEPERGFVLTDAPEWQDELNAYERAQVRTLARSDDRVALAIS